jgi:hypothetical protein
LEFICYLLFGIWDLQNFKAHYDITSALDEWLQIIVT